jgi:ethanolamine utilization protein EutN
VAGGDLVNLGKVIGTVVATTVYPGLEGVRLLVVQPLDRHLAANGRPVVAADGVAMAAPGDLVAVVASREASLALPITPGPVDHAITAIVDAVETVGNAAP